jgi:hypothetical protein
MRGHSQEMPSHRTDLKCRYGTVSSVPGSRGYGAGSEPLRTHVFVTNRLVGEAVVVRGFGPLGADRFRLLCCFVQQRGRAGVELVADLGDDLLDESVNPGCGEVG